MKQITIEQLHQETERWVKEATVNGGIVVTDQGQSVAMLSQSGLVNREQWLQSRLADLGTMPVMTVDSAELISEDRSRS